MNLDLPTILVVLIAASLVLGGAVLFVALRLQRHVGLLWWGAGLLANAASYGAFALRFAGQVELSILLTNLLTGLTLPMHTAALQHFHGPQARRLPPVVVWGTVPLMVLNALLWLGDDLKRNTALGLVLTLQGLVFAWHAWGLGRDVPRVAGRWLLLAGTTAMVVILALRTVYMLHSGSGPAQLRVPPEAQAMTYLVVLMALLTNTIGFVLMQMEQALDRLHDAATHDALTGTANRRALMDRFECALSLARRGERPLAVLMIDIDHFKQVNDRYGHPAGDAVLREVAHRIQQRLRRHDLLARYGGEEFVVLLPDTDRDAAIKVAEAVREAVQAGPLIVGQLSIPVTVSVGVHSRVPAPSEPQGDQTADQMLDASDRAVYRAKAGGRNRVESES